MSDLGSLRVGSTATLQFVISLGAGILFAYMGIAGVIPFWPMTIVLAVAIASMAWALWRWDGWVATRLSYRSISVTAMVVVCGLLAYPAVAKLYRLQQNANVPPAPTPTQINATPPATLNGNQSQQINGVHGPVTINNNPPVSVPGAQRRSEHKTPPTALTIQQHSEGPNSPNVLGNNNTFHFGPPTPFLLTADQRETVRSVLAGQQGQQIDLLCVERGCGSVNSVVAAINAAGWPPPSNTQMPGLKVAGYAAADFSAGNHIVYREEARNAAELLQKALAAVSVQADLLPWSAGESTLQVFRMLSGPVCLTIGNPK